MTWPAYKICRFCRKRFAAPPGVGRSAFRIRKFCTRSCFASYQAPDLSSRNDMWKEIKAAYSLHGTVTSLAASFKMRPSEMSARLTAMRKAGFKLPYKNKRRLVDVLGVEMTIGELAEMLECDEIHVRGRLYSGGNILKLGVP